MKHDLSAIGRHARQSVMTETEYFAWKATAFEPLKPLGKPCHDCAVVWGLYSEISDALAKQPPEIIEACSVRWFCHNNPSRACRGNIDRLAAARKHSSPPSSERSSPGRISNPPGEHQEP